MTSPGPLVYRITGPDGGTRTFNDAPDSNGVEWWMKDLDGWHGPEVRTDATPRTFEHGMVTGRQFYDGRPMTVSGWLYSPSGITNLRLARESLLAAVETATTPALLLVDETPARQAQVLRAGKVGMRISGQSLLEFDIPILAPDPRRYSQTLTTVTVATTSGTAVTPGGNFRDGTPATILLAGGASLFEATTGLNWAASGTRQVKFDTAAGTVTYTDDGSPAWDAVGVSATGIMLQPGVTYTFTRVAGAASVSYRDAWV